MHLRKFRTAGVPRFMRQRCRRWASRLLRGTGGASTIEFALIAPIFITTALMGTELAYYVTTRLQLSQIAVAVADNAARLGQTENTGVTPTITENDIDSVMFGAMQQGKQIDLQANGRVILSSLERDNLSGHQYIHWQRCRGTRQDASQYGVTGAGLNDGALTGVGKDRDLQAPAGSAVMVAEVYYSYQGLFARMLGPFPVVREEAMFIIRDDRNLGDAETSGVSPGASGSRCT